jgi:hypothetical protein
MGPEESGSAALRGHVSDTTLESHRVSDTVMATKMKRHRRDDRLAQRGPRRACAQ